jgi:hypothetical protein
MKDLKNAKYDDLNSEHYFLTKQAISPLLDNHSFINNIHSQHDQV